MSDRWVASANPIGMLTRPKLMDPFQIVRMSRHLDCSGTGALRPGAGLPFPTKLPSSLASETSTRPLPAASPLRERRTIPRLWLDGVAKERPTAAYLTEEADGWREHSWAEAATAVDELAHGLLALGVQKGDAFAILGSTRLEWALFDFALALVGGVTAPIYANSSPKDCAHVVEHSEAVGILVEDEAQRAKIDGLQLRHVLSFGDLDDLRARGREHARAHPDAVREAADAVEEDDLFTYIYTSGTTGPPKACMIRHRNYFAMVAKIDALDEFVVDDDVLLLYLPLAHNFGLLTHLAGPYGGYGVTHETTALKVNRPSRFRFGTAGPALHGVELRIADDGEVLIRSDTIFAGYYKDEAATAEVLTDDGWLRSGDVGELDADGFLKITDRKKDLIVTAGGKNVSPQNLENALKTSKYVSQALVVGDRKPYVAALITLDDGEIAGWRELGGTDVNGLVQGIVEGVNADLSRFEQIKRFTILPRDFSAEHGEVTPTLKLKRRVCQEHFAREVEALYS